MAAHLLRITDPRPKVPGCADHTDLDPGVKVRQLLKSSILWALTRHGCTLKLGESSKLGLSPIPRVLG